MGTHPHVCHFELALKPIWLYAISNYSYQSAGTLGAPRWLRLDIHFHFGSDCLDMSLTRLCTRRQRGRHGFRRCEMERRAHQSLFCIAPPRHCYRDLTSQVIQTLRLLPPGCADPVLHVSIDAQLQMIGPPIPSPYS